MLGDDQVAGANDHPLLAQLDQNRLADVLRGHRVAAALQVDKTIRAHLAGALGGEAVGGSGGQRGELLRRQQVDGAPAGGGVDPPVGGVGEPVLALRLQIRPAGKGAAHEEIVLDVVDHPLHLPLGAGAPHPAGVGDETIVLGEVQEERVPGRARTAGQLHLGHVVIEQLPGPAAEEGKGRLVTGQELWQRHAGGELDIQHAGETQHHQKEVDLHRLALAIGESAAIGPVDLRLLAGRGLEADGGFGLCLPLGPEPPEEAAQDAQTAAVAHGAHLLQQAHRRERARLIALPQIRLVGIELRRAGRLGERHRGRLQQELVDGVARVAGDAGNRAARVAFVEQLLDVHPFLHGKHASPSLAP